MPKVSTMSRALLAASVAVLIAGCASSPSNTSGDSGTAAAKPAATPAKPARTAGEIRMDEILDNPQALAVLRKYAPAIADHPQIGMSRGMTLAQVAGYAEAGLTPELLSSIVGDLNKL